MRIKVLLCVICFSLAISPVIQAEVLYISHKAFQPAVGSHVAIHYDSYAYMSEGSGGGAYMEAPVYLPKDAVIQGIFLIYYDDGSGLARARLSRTTPWIGTYEVLFECESSGEANFLRRINTWTCPIAGGRKISESCAYAVEVFLPYASPPTIDYRLYGVRIQYILPST